MAPAASRRAASSWAKTQKGQPGRPKMTTNMRTPGAEWELMAHCDGSAAAGPIGSIKPRHRVALSGLTVGAGLPELAGVGAPQQVAQLPVDAGAGDQQVLAVEVLGKALRAGVEMAGAGAGLSGDQPAGGEVPGRDALVVGVRSEERRVGKECRSRWSAYQ